MKRRHTAITAVAAAAVAGTAIAQEPGPVAVSAAPRIHDIDADRTGDGRLRLEAETSKASRVRFTYRGRRYRGRLVEVDREDGTREWARTVRARKGDGAGGHSVTVRVRACGDGTCVRRKSVEYIERPGEDD